MTTTTTTARELHSVLNEYQIHLTGGSAASQSLESTTSSSATNPATWPTDSRRMPNYRPIDRNRTADERPNGSNGAERAFLTVMFSGVVLNAVSADNMREWWIRYWSVNRRLLGSGVRLGDDTSLKSSNMLLEGSGRADAVSLPYSCEGPCYCEAPKERVPTCLHRYGCTECVAPSKWVRTRRSQALRFWLYRHPHRPA